MESLHPGTDLSNGVKKGRESRGSTRRERDAGSSPYPRKGPNIFDGIPADQSAGAGDSQRFDQSGAPGMSFQQEMLEKAKELFQLCDKEEKGFITKRDMQRLQNELPLTPEQLEDVFDNLDQDNNGYLTPLEFSMGLGKFIGVEVLSENEGFDTSVHEDTFVSGWDNDLSMLDDEDERRFCVMMQQHGAAQVFKDQSEVRELWARLRKDRPELLATFEKFLFKVSAHIQEVHLEKDSMEQALRRRECDHDKEVRSLYEEMEHQIKIEKDRLLYQDSSRQIGKNVELQKELQIRERELEGIVGRQRQLERQLHELSYEQTETRIQNERLRHLNENLLEQLEHTRHELQTTQFHLGHLQDEAQREKKRKDKDVLNVSKNMQKEKESLLRQLELLREMNRKLRDERDAHEARKMTSPSKKPLLKKGSVIGRYLLEDKPIKRQLNPAESDCTPCEDVSSEPNKKSSKCDSNDGADNANESMDVDGLTDKKEETVTESLREEPVGMESMDPLNMPPERVFKVVFIGNSGVGKTSFIHYFCQGQFLTDVCSTVGIDYQMRSLIVDNVSVVLQLWDTAGQER
ncbi:EF-hand calcium-binding domain-containing protein 4A [Polypterus senegalus]|uniref:EF-hand calcium-binding domain-containing protein 4A n=1 Tax=Polypterus senegalus TaxID=55291 RepID=UPI0019637536|nr:EF-hand calcium-binding domain-containing protein 4A [Polypterus senegalus]XP_039619908.1 EF-hand calcium-binding domain-containing protein 4A [Polypterus senegalus]XP_039619916.1 EF-hand calcium-binding domain-containing protein 4A [Polypterus senegalus]XP_039619925.1 EF-hand calcium-binding domain-containing protein 4A [Polypterus senegalus]XP_039619932.1 EF-hand calcium-binding domain-containing protein 4A [Polypterus senegalus]